MSKKIPKLRIEGWNPGTQDHDKVSIVEDVGIGAWRPWLLDVRLDQAKVIVGCAEHCRRTFLELRILNGE